MMDHISEFIPAIIHPNLKLLSHSSDELLDSCSRKYQIYKLRPKFGSLEVEDGDYHLDFGSAVGIGTQEYYINKSIIEAYWAMFKSWNADIDDDSGSDKKKSFWHALNAIDKFQLFQQTELRNYELVSFDGKPATELGFKIDCGDGFYYRGFLDMLLWDNLKEELVPYEGKTTGMWVVDEAQYRNKGQANGYKLVIDAVSKKLGLPIKNSYKVIYAIYQSSRNEWIYMPFNKSNTTLARWIKNILMHKEHIQLMAKHDYFPMNGASCYSYNKQCKYFGTCEMKDELLFGEGLSRVEETIEDDNKYQFKFTLDELITTLLDK